MFRQSTRVGIGMNDRDKTGPAFSVNSYNPIDSIIQQPLIPWHRIYIEKTPQDRKYPFQSIPDIAREYLFSDYIP